jgi:predicted Fe-Mo cluster-binding NifX family protein
MMKLAIAQDEGRVSAHFGHCEGYAIYQIRDSVIYRHEELASPPHEPGKLPEFLASHDVTHVIAGGMGPKAADLFGRSGIHVILGVSGPVDIIAQDFIAGRIVPGESSCHHGH